MQSEVLEVQAFANEAMQSVKEGVMTDSSSPAMTTPILVTAAQWVIQGSTICLIC